MIYLSCDDYYEVYLKSIISDVDRDTLTMLYQPIIGADAVAIYLSLYSDYKKMKDSNEILTHQDLICSTSLPIPSIQEARRKLEGIGLLQTFYKEDKDQKFYKYILFAPKTPKEFFDDILFKGLLIEKIGEKKVQALVRKYKEKKLDLDGYNEITDGFKSVFSPNLDSGAYASGNNIKGGYGRKIRDISKGFDNALFLKTLEDNYHIISSAIGKRDLKKIAEISLLYGVEEIMMADLLSQSYNPNGDKKIDFDKLKSLAINDKDYQALRISKNNESIAYDTESRLGKKIKMMSTISTLDYLRLKQNNGAVSPSDIKLITELNEDYGLNPGVINALVDYCLEKNNNQLPRLYVTKIASTLARERVETTLDTMNFLLKSQRKKTYSPNENVSENNKEIEKKEISDQELDSLLEDM